MARIPNHEGGVNRSHVRGVISTSLDPARFSAQLVEANRQLHARRARLVERGELPSHQSTGWLSGLSQSLADTERSVGDSAEIDLPQPSPSTTIEHRPQSLPDTIRIYPSMAFQAIKQDHVPGLRVWHLLRVLDQAGSGRVASKAFFDRFGRKHSTTYVVGKRRLRQLLQQYDGRFWTRANGYIWYAGTERLCKQLKVDTLKGRSVTMPVSALITSNQQFRAHLYASVHSRRVHSNPIARITIEAITGISERTQREYDRLLNIERTACFHVGVPYTDDAFKAYRWKYGHGFRYVDAHGQHGRRAASYVARRLGNLYHVKQQKHAPVGRKKKINRNLNDLVKLQAQGNEQDTIKKLYYSNGARAVNSMQTRGVGETIYWRVPMPGRRHKQILSEDACYFYAVDK